MVKYYRCAHCKNVVEKVVDKGVPVVCCGQPMEELIPGTSDGAAEKHVPVVLTDGEKVRVEIGSVAHPMLPEHYIQFITLETKEGGIYRKELHPGEAPAAEFHLNPGDEVLAVYEYCNLHGLWRK